MASGKPGLFQSVQHRLDGLPNRQKILLGASVGTLYLLAMIALGYFVLNSVDAQAQQLSKRQEQLQMIQTMQSKMLEARALVSDAESRICGSTQSVSAFIEGKATPAGVKENLQGIKRGQEEQVGKLTQVRYRVTMDRASIQGTHELIHDIETSGFMMLEKVDYTRKLAKGGSFALDATIDLVAYECKKE
jgi:hypothetical protein